MSIRHLLALSTLCFCSTLLISEIAIAHEVSPIEGLRTPESVIQASNGNIYVSEINGFGVDGDGQISVIERGQQRVLVSGLNDPKGLALVGNTLYIADKTQIFKVDLMRPTPTAEVFVAASGFPSTPQFLNDIAVDPQGNLYVSDSGDLLGSGRGGAVYRVSPQGTVSLLADGKLDARILCPNGLWVEQPGKSLLMVDFSSGELMRFDLSTQRVTTIAKGFGGGDGVVVSNDGTMYVSDWKAGKVFSVTPQGTVRLLHAGYQAAADIALMLDGKHLLVPDMKAGRLFTLGIHD